MIFPCDIPYERGIHVDPERAHRELRRDLPDLVHDGIRAFGKRKGMDRVFPGPVVDGVVDHLLKLTVPHRRTGAVERLSP